MFETFRFQQAPVGHERVVMEGRRDGFDREVSNFDQEHYSDTTDNNCRLLRSSHENQIERNRQFQAHPVSRGRDDEVRDDRVEILRQTSVGISLDVDVNVRGPER
jgi:hypothetical protein